MNRPRLSKSGIEYLDYAWNFYSGCLNGQNGVCPLGDNCWARKLAARFPEHYPNNFQPTFYPEAFLSPLSLMKPSRIGVAFMGDLFGDWVDPFTLIPQYQKQHRFKVPRLHFPLKDYIFEVIKSCPQHTFLFLTKNPIGLLGWSPFPENCWVGVSVPRAYDDTPIGHFEAFQRIRQLGEIKATVKFVSFEPLLESIASEFEFGLDLTFKAYGINWVIIGAQTPYSEKTAPKIAWVREIIEAADKAGAKVFLKENLRPLLYQESNGPWGRPPLWAANSSGNLRQEFPL